MRYVSDFFDIERYFNALENACYMFLFLEGEKTSVSLHCNELIKRAVHE